MKMRDKKKVFMYSESGNYLRSFESLTDCCDYYGLSKGNFFTNKEYRLMGDGNYITKERIGRKGLMEALLIDNNKFCKKLSNDYEVEVFNILGEKIGEFRSAREFIEITKINTQTMKNYLYTSSIKYIKKDRELIIKRK